MQQQQNSLRDIDFKYYMRHYFRLFWKWKWYTLIVGPIAAVGALFGILKFGLLESPPLPATVFIGLDSPKANAYDDLEGANQNKERLLLSRPFLEKVAKQMSLQFVLSEHSRSEIFDSVRVDSAAPTGSYRFEITNENRDYYNIYYATEKQHTRKQSIQSGQIATLNTLVFSHLYLKLSETFVKNPFSFSFSIIPIRSAVDRTLAKMKVTSPNPSEQTYYFSVTLTGTDYPLVAQTVNTVANMFIESNFSLQKRRMKESLSELEKQLSAAEQQQSQSKGELQNFLNKNPSVGLTQGTQQTMSELISLETGSRETGNLIEETNLLKDKWASATKDEKVSVISEMLVFLQMHGSLAAPSLQAGFTQLTQERETARQHYAISHPVFAEIEGKFAALSNRTIQAIDAFIMQQKRLVSDRTYSIQKITSKLQGLPSQELQMAELQKRQGVDADIYAKVLAKYNETKVAETIEGPDVFVMEYAVQPIPPSLIQQYAKSGAILFAITLLFSFGPPVGFDTIDKTARTEQALIRMLPYRFLETIPLIKKSKKRQFIKANKICDPSLDAKASDAALVYNREILINDPAIQPPSAVELFRSLSTKIQLDIYNSNDRSIGITSFEMNEGKSTISANLAISLAEHGIKTILIDCDLRRGVVHNFFSLAKNPGLSDYLTDGKKTDHQPPLSSVPIQHTSFSNLWVISSGTIVDNPQRLLRMNSLSLLKQQLLEQSYFVIIDSPPIAVAADSALLSNIISRYVLVVRSGHTNVVKLRKMLDKDYPMIDKKVLGVVLNMGENTVPTRYYSYYSNKTGNRHRVDI